MEQQSLIEANKSRAILIATACARRAERAGHVGAWNGYQASEGLDGILVRDDILRYARPGHDDPNGDFANIFFHEPKLSDTVNVDWGEEKHIEKDVIERYSSHVHKVKGVRFDEKISHTFSKTTSLQEAFKVAIEESEKFGVSESGISAEVALKLSAEYSRQWGESDTHSDTSERELELDKDFEGDIHYDAVRSIDKVERKITAVTNMDYRIGFVSGPIIPPENRPYYNYEWTSLDEFISVGRGFAAADKAMYAAFMAYPLTQGEIDAIKDAGKQNVEYLVHYDNVNSQDIEIK